MDLNTFGNDLIKQLARIANSAEAIEAGMKGKSAGTTTSTTPAAATETKPKADAKAKTETKPKAEAKTEAKPKHDLAEMKAALISVKDTISMDAAKAIFSKHGYDKMSEIQPVHYDTIFDEATAALEAGAEETEADDDL